jgi:hypothetical protein
MRTFIADTENPNVPRRVFVEFIGVPAFSASYNVYADDHNVGRIVDTNKGWVTTGPTEWHPSGPTFARAREAAQHLIDTYEPGPIAYPAVPWPS